MKAAIYARVSTSNGRQDTDNQLSELRRFASTQGWAIVHKYVDEETGKTAHRAAFKRLFADAAKRKFDRCCSGLSTGLPGRAPLKLCST